MDIDEKAVAAITAKVRELGITAELAEFIADNLGNAITPMVVAGELGPTLPHDDMVRWCKASGRKLRTMVDGLRQVAREEAACSRS